jgi:hypothetical protein
LISLDHPVEIVYICHLGITSVVVMSFVPYIRLVEHGEMETVIHQVTGAVARTLELRRALTISTCSRLASIYAIIVTGSNEEFLHHPQSDCR